MQFRLGLLLERRIAAQQGELLRPSKEIAMRPLAIGAKPLRRTIAQSKLERVWLALDDLELDVQRLVSGLGVERPRRHRLKHPQVVDRIGTGGEGFIAEALALVDGKLMAYGTFLDLLLPLNVNATKCRLGARDKRKCHHCRVLLRVDFFTWDNLRARLAGIVQTGEQQGLALVKVLLADALLWAQG